MTSVITCYHPLILYLKTFCAMSDCILKKYYYYNYYWTYSSVHEMYCCCILHISWQFYRWHLAIIIKIIVIIIIIFFSPRGIFWHRTFALEHELKQFFSVVIRCKIIPFHFWQLFMPTQTQLTFNGAKQLQDQQK